MSTASIKVEIAFDSNFTTPDVDRTWTDVSAYGLLSDSASVEVTWGRANALSSAEAASLSLTLRNDDGRFTPGNSSSPYYPNVKLDRPIRVTITPPGSSTPSRRMTGYISQWPTVWPGGSDTFVESPISAVSRMGRLGLRNAMRAMIVEESISSGAEAVYSMDEPAGSVAAEDVTSNSSAPLTIAGFGEAPAFGGDGIEFSGGKYLTGGTSISLGTDPEFTFAVTFVTSTAPSIPARRLWGACGFASAAALAPYADGRPHRMVVTRATGGAIAAKVDDQDIVYIATDPGAVQFDAGVGFTGTLRDAAYWTTSFSSGDITDDFIAFNGGYGELSDASLERLAGYFNIPSAEVNADAGSVVMGGIDTSGMAAVDALRVVESTEGGVLIDARNGDLHLIGRRARYHSSSVLTLDLDNEDVSLDYSPILDRSMLRNDVTGTNAATSVGSIDSGATISRRATDAASVAEYGTAGASVEVAAADPSEAYAAASWLVANRGQPAPRVPTVTIDLGPLDAARQDEILAVEIGDRITITNRLSQDSTSEADFFVEGATEMWTASASTLTWSLSPIGLEDQVVIIDDAVFGQIDAGNLIGY